MKKIELDEMVIMYDDGNAVARDVFEGLVAWYTKHESFEGECLQQCDEPQLDAINILSKIADDIIKFKVEYKE